VSEGKRKAGFFAKLIGTMGYGLLLSVSAYFYFGNTFLGIEVSFAHFLLVGFCWPLLWALFWLIRLVTPMPFELLPRFFELFLVGPGHLAAWILFGKRQGEDSSEDAAPAPAAEAPPAAPAPTPAPPAEPPPSA
jgi:hypothetical protein